MQQTIEEERVYVVYFSDTISRTAVNYGDRNMYICPYLCAPIFCPCCQPVVRVQSQVRNLVVFFLVAKDY